MFDEITEDDEKIIDFNLWCGEAFPQKLNVTKPAQHGTTSTVCFNCFDKITTILNNNFVLAQITPIIIKWRCLNF